MPHLSAMFRVETYSPCLITWPRGQAARLNAKIASFDVRVTVHPSEGWSTRGADETDETTSVDSLTVVVTREEADHPPPPVQTPDGMTDLTFQGAYLRERLPAFQEIAYTVTNRFLLFFRYHLGTPQVQLVPRWEHSLHNPTWFDSEGKELRGGTRTAVAHPVPGARGELGTKRFKPSDLPDLEAFLASPAEPTLALTLLADAKTAWHERNLRRSVLELAICCEVMVKRKFFAASSPAGAAFDYLEDKAKVSVRVLELLDVVATEAFGRSFKREHSGNYQMIDLLFRCRNKIAHRGMLEYRDDSGNLQIAGQATVEGWWNAVSGLKDWLDSL